MEKAKLAQILGHQLKGIMLHVDLTKYYLLHHNRKCAIRHYNHVMCETKNFMLTNQYLIERFGEIIEPAKEAQIILPEDEAKLFDIWQQYERDTADFYMHLFEEDARCCWWKKLHEAAKKEIQVTKIF